MKTIKYLKTDQDQAIDYLRKELLKTDQAIDYLRQELLPLQGKVLSPIEFNRALSDAMFHYPGALVWYRVSDLAELLHSLGWVISEGAGNVSIQVKR